MATIRPAPWFREIAHLNRAAWPWLRSVRAATAVGAPSLAGFLLGHLPVALWVALGAMMCAAGEGQGSWRSRFRQLAFTAPIAATGFLSGYLADTPYPITIAIVAGAGFLSAVISSYGSAFSAGAMQALVFTVISLGLPDVSAPLQSIALYLCGVAFYALLMAAEALLDRHEPERAMLRDYTHALANFARAKAADGVAPASASTEACRRAVIDHSTTFYAALLEQRRNGRTHEMVSYAGVLDAAEQLLYAILAAQDAKALNQLAHWLDDVAQAMPHRRPLPAVAEAAQGDELAESARLFRQRLLAGGEQAPQAEVDAQAGSGARIVQRLDGLVRLGVGRTVLMNGAAVALSMAAAMAMRYLLPPNHWYWAPLTVAIVLKPDLGSVFARAVLRIAGTLVGVVIGALLVNLIPKGPGIVLAIALLAACLPWAKQVSYAVMTLALTPLVLVLLDMVARGDGVVDLAPERLVNTAIGGVIALVLGYFIWPRSHAGELSSKFSDALNAIADYLTAACRQSVTALWQAGRPCYVRLSDMRGVVSRCQVEPPPAGREAAAWFPLILDAERICDRIGARGANENAPVPPAAQVAAVAEAIRRAGDAHAIASANVSITDPFLKDIMRQVTAMERRLEKQPGA